MYQNNSRKIQNSVNFMRNQEIEPKTVRIMNVQNQQFQLSRATSRPFSNNNNRNFSPKINFKYNNSQSNYINKTNLQSPTQLKKESKLFKPFSIAQIIDKQIETQKQRRDLECNQTAAQKDVTQSNKLLKSYEKIIRQYGTIREEESELQQSIIFYESIEQLKKELTAKEKLNAELTSQLNQIRANQQQQRKIFHDKQQLLMLETKSLKIDLQKQMNLNRISKIHEQELEIKIAQLQLQAKQREKILPKLANSSNKSIQRCISE